MTTDTKALREDGLSDAECDAIATKLAHENRAGSYQEYDRALIRAGHAARGDEARDAEAERDLLCEMLRDFAVRPRCLGVDRWMMDCLLCDQSWASDAPENHLGTCHLGATPAAAIAAMTKREG